MATDPYAWSSTSPESPARDAAVVTPSNSVSLTNMAKAFYVGAAGDVAVVTARGSTVVIPAVPAGVIIPLQISRVNVTGTTASGIVALF